MSRQTLGSNQHPRTVAKRIAKLARKAALASDTDLVHRDYGAVVSVQPGPPRTLTITAGSDPTPIPGIRFRASYNAGVAPVAGDNVLIDVVGRDHVVVDKLAT